MRRRVVMHGPATLTVSLPNEWVKRNDIRKGDELEVEERGNALMVQTVQEKHPHKSIAVDLKGISAEGGQSIISVLHKSGYDEITATFDDSAMLKAIQERIASTLIGYEVVDHNTNTCSIRSISGLASEELGTLFRRTFLVTLAMADNSLEAVKSRNKKGIDDILVLEVTNNRLVNYCHRILNKQVNRNDFVTYKYTILWILESVADNFKYLLNYAKENEIQNALTLRLHAATAKLLRTYYEIFYSFSKEKIDLFQREVREHIEQIVDATHQSQEDTAPRVYLQNVAQLIYEATGSTIGLNY